VHWGAHCLYDFGRKIIKADHECEMGKCVWVGCLLMHNGHVFRVVLFIQMSSKERCKSLARTRYGGVDVDAGGGTS
jgi:hypothetical protein